MKRSWWSRWGLGLGVALTVGCGDDYETRVGAIMSGYDESTLTSTAPSVVTAGEPFKVGFSIWGSHCKKPSYEEVERLENGIRITPYARHYVGDRACTSILIEYPRQVEVVFEELGARVVELRGRPTTEWGVETLVSVEHDVTVEE